MSNQDYVASPDRPKWSVSAEDGEIRRVIKDGTEGELIAKYDAAEGVVEILGGPEKEKQYRLPLINVMKGQNGGHFTRFGKIGVSEEVPADAPPRPKKSFKLGEKSPGRVEWEARYMPQTFIDRWGVERMQIRTAFEEVERVRTKKDGSGDRERYTDRVPQYRDVAGLKFDVDKVISGEQRLIARAKTCLTHVPAQSPDLSEYDDSLDAEDDDGI